MTSDFKTTLVSCGVKADTISKLLLKVDNMDDLIDDEKIIEDMNDPKLSSIVKLLNEDYANYVLSSDKVSFILEKLKKNKNESVIESDAVPFDTAEGASDSSHEEVTGKTVKETDEEIDANVFSTASESSEKQTN